MSSDLQLTGILQSKISSLPVKKLYSNAAILFSHSPADKKSTLPACAETLIQLVFYVDKKYLSTEKEVLHRYGPQKEVPCLSLRLAPAGWEGSPAPIPVCLISHWLLQPYFTEKYALPFLVRTEDLDFCCRLSKRSRESPLCCDTK